jgi:N-acetylglutamate synthase-like GNAT family acetyltransferase
MVVCYSLSMQDVSIVPLEQEHLAQVGNWTSRDVTKTLLKLPGVSVGSTPDSFGWAAVRNQEVLALATVQLNKEHVGYLNCVVKPTETRHGVGTQIIDYVLKQSVIEDLVHLHALIDQDNTAARKILEAQGFTWVGYGSDNRLEFARHKYQTAAKKVS